MKKAIKARLSNWLTPRRVYHILREVSLTMTFAVCLIAANSLIDNDIWAVMVGTIFTIFIHIMTKLAGYIDAQLERENKVTLDPSKGKYAVLYYNEDPFAAWRLTDEKEAR